MLHKPFFYPILHPCHASGGITANFMPLKPKQTTLKQPPPAMATSSLQPSRVPTALELTKQPIVNIFLAKNNENLRSN